MILKCMLQMKSICIYRPQFPFILLSQHTFPYVEIILLASLITSSLLLNYATASSVLARSTWQNILKYVHKNCSSRFIVSFKCLFWGWMPSSLVIKSLLGYLNRLLILYDMELPIPCVSCEAKSNDRTL